MSLPCPDCGDPLTSRGVCGSCGHGKTSVKGKPLDPDWWRCCNVEFGQRCLKAGSISHGTNGGGPWYCQQHAFSSHTPTAPPGGFQALFGRVPRYSPLRLVKAEADAERAAIQGE